MTGANNGNVDTPQAPADPHPSREEHYDRIPNSGGVKPKGKDIGPNPAVHDGKQPPKTPPDEKSR